MCESLADGGRRCLDLERLGSRDVSYFAPMPTEGIEDISWRADEGVVSRVLAYRKAAACWSLILLEEVRDEEPAVTATVRATATAVGGECHGLASRVKAPDSLARKLDSRMAAASSRGGAPVDAEAIARGEVDDVLRYTIRVDHHETLPGALEETLDELRAYGWTLREVRDSYLSENSYKGLHVIARTPEQHAVEIQVHSSKSIAVKDMIHADYAIARDLARSRADRRAAEERCIAGSRQVENPPGLGGYYPAGSDDDSEARGQVRGVLIRKSAYTRGQGGGAR